MIVVSDTSVITNLIQLGQVDLLPRIFQKLIIPDRVYEELINIPSQAIQLKDLSWIEIQAISDPLLTTELSKELDRGEAEAISLAVSLKADVLLMDEKKGRSVARKFGIPVTGLLGILLEAKELGLLTEIKPLLEMLRVEIGFRIAPDLYALILDKAKEL